MKKGIAILLALACALTLAACGGNSGGASPSQAVTPAEASPSGRSLNVENGLTKVKITLPAVMFAGQAAEEVISAAKEKGIDQVTANADGSYTYTISKKQHAALLAEMKKSLTDAVAKLKEDTSNAFIKDIEYNSDFTAFTVYVDQSANSTFYGIAIFGIGIADMYYQLFSGVKAEDIKIVFTVKNADTKAVIHTITYPDDLKNT